jgi:hypothetical protein
MSKPKKTNEYRDNKKDPPNHIQNPGKASTLEPSFGNAPLGEGYLQKSAEERFLVHVKAYRRREGDEDNLCEKYHVDLLRYSGCLRTDAPGETKIEVSQEKVGSKEEEFTQIDIYKIKERKITE